MRLKMTLICLHPELLFVADPRDLLVAVIVG
jgi:hypothetical protein